MINASLKVNDRFLENGFRKREFIIIDHNNKYISVKFLKGDFKGQKIVNVDRVDFIYCMKEAKTFGKINHPITSIFK